MQLQGMAGFHKLPSLDEWVLAANRTGNDLLSHRTVSSETDDATWRERQEIVKFAVKVGSHCSLQILVLQSVTQILIF